MILLSARVTNFRQLYGENRINFALPGDRNVTVVLGENGSGKTTLLEALKWCLYGTLNLENADDLLSHKAAFLAKDGAEVRVRVELSVQVGRKQYLVSREARWRKTGATPEVAKLPVLTVASKNDQGSMQDAPDPQHLIRSLLPENLAHFFFFRGEDLEKMPGADNSDNLKTAVETFVDLTVIDRGRAHLEHVETTLERQFRDSSSGEAKRLGDEINTVRGEIEDHERKLAKSIDEKKKLQNQLEQLYEALRAVDTERVELRAALGERIIGLEARKKEKTDEIFRVISRDGYLALCPFVLPKVVELADQARERGELPAIIKPRFVDDLLEGGTCVCGTPLDEARKHTLLDWKTKLKFGALEAPIIHLRGASASFTERLEHFRTEYRRLREEMAGTSVDLESAGDELSKIESELVGRVHGPEDIKNLQDSIRAVNEDLMRVERDEGHHGGGRDQLRARLEQLDADRVRETRKEEKGKIIADRIHAVRAVVAALDDIRAGWIGVVQEYIETELKARWAEVAQLDRLIEFDNEFRLTMKERGADGAWQRSAASSANRSALALAFVAALVRLAAEAGADPDVGKNLWFSGGEYPVVMDAAFAKMDEYFKRTIPRGLRKTIPQVVLFTSLDQWRGEVEAALSSGVGKAYIAELHIPRETGRTVQFMGKSCDYVASEPSTEQYDWTLLKEVSV